MRAASLFAVFVLAKAAVLSEHTIPVSAWTPAAYFWQDALVALLFGLVESALLSRDRRERLVGKLLPALYWALAVYTALNIPVGRAVSTPLTWPMLLAARGPLVDSIVLYVTWTNAMWVALTLAAAFVLPSVFRRWNWRATAAVVPFVALGPLAATRVDTVGLERNAVATLFGSAIPRLPSHAASGDWRASPFSANSGRGSVPESEASRRGAM